MYRIIFTRRALKDLEGIDKEMQKRIAVKLEECSKEPLRYAKKLKGLSFRDTIQDQQKPKD